MCFESICKYLCRIFTKKEEPAIATSLENVKFEDAIPFVPVISQAKVVKIYDGDTFTIACRLKFDTYETNKYYRFSVRIRGIDTPELKTKNETEKKLAIEARNALCSKIENRIIELKNIEYEKYGRILADVIIDGIDVGKSMIQENYAVAYNGKTKIIPKEWAAAP